MTSPPDLKEKLAAAQRELAVATETAERLSAATRDRYGTDPAIASGIRRKPNPRADARRHGQYDREAQAWQGARDAEAKVAGLEQAIARAERDKPVPYTEAELRAARFIRDRWGVLHKVVKVNAKSVTVETDYSWTARIPRERILEVRAG